MNIPASLILLGLGYICQQLPKHTPKWGDDRTMEQLGSFFYGAALVMLFVY